MLKDVGAQLERLRMRRTAAVSAEDIAKPGRLLSFYTRIMTKVTDCERCSVFIHDPARDMVWLKSGTGVGESDIEVPKEGSIAGTVIATGKPVIKSGMENEPGPHKELEAKTGFVTRSIMCVPIVSPIRNEVTGAFQLLNKSDGNFTNDDLSLAQEIAGHLQVEVDQIYLDQEIFGLTGTLYSAARKAMITLVVTLVILFAVLFLGLLFYIASPALLN
jgi:GAF domain-containing protein